MAKNFYGALGLTGGVDGDLDYLDGAGLADGDGAIVITATTTYMYTLDDSSGAAESSPDVITPDTNPGTKRWLLVKMAGAAPTADWDLITKNFADNNYAGYVDRGDPGSVDFAIGVLTTDQTWRDLDLSSIVPAGAVAVSLAVYIVDDLVAQTLQFRRNGNSNSFAVSSINTSVANVAVINNMVVSCDANRIIEYWATTTTWGGINITVLGWWL